jgi:alpha/beta superfamily hydrolase
VAADRATDQEGADVPEIVPNSVLPAVRRPLTITTADGLRLVGELALPEDRTPLATMVCLHPLPTHGGMMDSHLFRKSAWRLPALAGIAVLRFNTRGTSSAHGRSEGEFDAAEGEGHDLRAAVQDAVALGLPHPWLVGWSFGTDVVLKHGDVDPVEGAILLSPPLKFSDESDLDRWAQSRRPLVALVPELDDYLRPDEARQRFARVPQCEVVGVDGAKHLWVGEKHVRIVLDAIAGHLVPGSSPLPGEFDGPMERWNDL